ncbi:MAG: hypothetical protein ACLFTK_16310, partial [Anaerolineales bacterium]
MPHTRITYAGWADCARLANDHAELVITTQVGPRIIRLALPDGPNLLYEAFQGQTGGDTWRNYGGHRLWHAPEQRPRTYAPDNDPVTLETHGDMVRVIQATEAETHIQKSMDIALAPDAARVRVTHRLVNHSVWPVHLAPWALTVMAPGGTAILPLPPRSTQAENLLP